MITAKEMVGIIDRHGIGSYVETHPDRFHTLYTVSITADKKTAELLERLIVRSASSAKVYNTSATCIFEDATIILLR